MFGNWLETILIVIILGGIGLVIFKGGAANPVSTGGLDRKMIVLEADVSALNVKLGGVETKVGAVETRVIEFEQRAATKGDIERMEARLAGSERKLEALDGRLDTTEQSLARIESDVGALKTVVNSVAEGLRVYNLSLQGIADRVAANGAITAQVPAFMERVLRDTATTAAESGAVRSQVDRLYDIITTRGFEK